MEQKQGSTFSQQVGSLLPTIHEMSCFTQFCSCKVDNLNDDQKETFRRVSERFSIIFSDINWLYADISERERLSIKNREEVSSHD